MPDAEALLSLPLPTLIFVAMAATGRAMGALFGLWGIYYVVGPATILRMGVAIAISLPLLGTGAADFAAMSTDLGRLEVMIVPVREFIIGVAIGFLSSIPFFAILGAAIVIDQYRGDFSPAAPGPEGEQIGSYATMNVVMALFLFAEAGGFIILVGTIYESYGVLNPGVGGLSLSPEAGTRIGVILQNVFVSLVIIALPLIMLLLLAEFGLNMAFRLAGQIKMPAVDFLLKNMIFVAVMPILIFGLARSMEAAFDRAPQPLRVLEELVGE